MCVCACVRVKAKRWDSLLVGRLVRISNRTREQLYAVCCVTLEHLK